MTAHRLDRRLAILRGKRNGAFDRDQYYLERAARARVARRTRVLLRRMRPVVMVTPRWSQARRFLDDVATDLLLGEPRVVCRTLSLAPLEGRTPHQAWNWLVLAITEFCDLRAGDGAWRMVSRHGFRHTLKDLFQRAEEDPTRRCLMIHGLEHMHVEALRDLIHVFEDHAHQREGEPRFNLLLAGSIDAPHFDIAGTERLVLTDFSEVEALETLVEHLGVDEIPKLRDLVSIVGGVPAMLDTFGQEVPGAIGEVIADRRAAWRVMGNLALEMQQAFSIVAADDALHDRIEEMANADQPLPLDPRDDALIRAGLVRLEGGRAELRAPVIGDLALLE
ncbi:MAG: hypothetical protein KC621_03345 [Myxococcales bacterium]|nr:hypothetical protein [Myxococcales bacterium]